MLVKVKTPTMLMNSESDHRTPISETEQFYQGITGPRGRYRDGTDPVAATHAIHDRPSNMMAKPAYIIYWFEKYRPKVN